MPRTVEVTHYGLKLPSLSDNFAISIYMQSAVSLAIGLLILFKPSAINAQTNSVIQMVIPAVCITIAFAIQLVNIWRNTVVKAKLIGGHEGNIRVMTNTEYKYTFGSTVVSSQVQAKLDKQDLKYGVTR